MSRRSTNPRCELYVVEQLRYSPRSEHQVENTVKNYARRNRQTKFHSQLKTAVCWLVAVLFPYSLREKWSTSLMKRREYLDEQIHSLIDKPG